MPTPVDHLVIAVIVVVVPLYASIYGWPRIKRMLADGTSGARIRTYWWNIGLQWMLTAGAFAAWLYADRPFGDLGFVSPLGWQFWLGLGLALAAVGGLTLQYRLALATGEGRRKLLESLQSTAGFTPQTRPEMAHFTVLSVTAGFCEEVLYRGFLIWYLIQFTGTSLSGVIAAVVGSAIIFGACHLYQGRKGAAQVTVLALVTGGLYVLSGSLWIVIAMHIYIDVAGGLMSLALHQWQGELVRTVDTTP